MTLPASGCGCWRDRGVLLLLYVVDSRRDLYVAEVAWTAKGGLENPPREVRSLQKLELVS